MRAQTSLNPNSITSPGGSRKSREDSDLSSPDISTIEIGSSRGAGILHKMIGLCDLVGDDDIERFLMIEANYREGIDRNLERRFRELINPDYWTPYPRSRDPSGGSFVSDPKS